MPRYQELIEELMDPEKDYDDELDAQLNHIISSYPKFSWFPAPDTIFDQLKKYIGKWVGREELFLERCRRFLTGKVKWNIEWSLLQLEVEVYTQKPKLLPKMREYGNYCKNNYKSSKNCTCTKLTSLDGKRYVVFDDHGRITNFQLD